MKQLSESHKQLGFSIHAMVFVSTMALLGIINAAIGPPWWVPWVLLGWGVGLLSHWWFILGPGACRDGTG